MTNRRDRDPFALPEWHPLHREAHLVSPLIATGATGLGRGGYGNSFGEYYAAFFALSIGIERFAKLIVVADYALGHSGALPNQAVVRQYHHRLNRLLHKAEEILESRHLKLRVQRADSRSARRLSDASMPSPTLRGAYTQTLRLSAIQNFVAGQEPVQTNGGLRSSSRSSPGTIVELAGKLWPKKGCDCRRDDWRSIVCPVCGRTGKCHV
jgi:hypothetical protein